MQYRMSRAITSAAVVVALAGTLQAVAARASQLDLSSPDGWRTERRGTIEFSRRSVSVEGKMALWKGQEFGDFELRCRAQIAEGVKDGAVWVRFRYRSDNEHYALAMRGWPANDLFLFRFRPGGGDRLLALQPLDFDPTPGKWYEVRVECVGPEIMVYLNNEAEPRLWATDDEPIPAGLVGVGGGYRAAEYADLSVETVSEPRVDPAALSDQALKIDFRPSGQPPTGWQASLGEPYSPERGFGWDRDMSGLARMRGLVLDTLTDTVISVAHDTHEAAFTIDRADGDYTLLVAGGDPAYPTHFEFEVVGEKALSECTDLARGALRIAARPVTVKGGKLSLRFHDGTPGSTRGGSTAWVALDPQAANPDLFAAATAAWERQSGRLAALAKAARDEEARRRQARGASRSRYRPVVLPRAAAGRQTVSLDGTWLFLPDQERDPGKDPRDRKVGDADWHGLEVPQFWTPIYWWIYGPGEGTSDKWVQREEQRMAGLSFDPAQTHAGWYRQWITIPKSYERKRLALQFDAVAMTCEVWLNGQHLGRHVGMFAPFEVELPAEAIRWNERNLLTLLVTDGAYRGQGDPGEVLGTEVTVEITREMLNSLPRGMYGRSAGIWQPARLVATERTYLDDVFARTSLDGLDVEVSTGGEVAEGLTCRATVTDRQDRTVLAQAQGAAVGGKAVLSQHGLTPKLWTPDTPNLYVLRVELLGKDGKPLDAYECNLGFRTFEVRGNRLFLNGRPYWLRGANHAPSGLEPNSRAVSRDFLKRMHDGNTVVLRAHGSSFTSTWLEAADELGVGVSMEGLWPWVMIGDTPPPSEELLKVWEAEWTGVMRHLRNHPSLLMWTLNNESYWYRARDPELRKRKWEIATHMIQAMRALDPTRPVVCDSGYVRKPEVYEQELKPNGSDDGDLDDAHMYYGWYAPGPWSLYPEAPDAEPPLERGFSGTRPAISQEFSTGYPNNDTGHPTRKYIDQHYVAQAWIGDYAYEDRDPAAYLARNAWMAKELTELARRHRSKLCGLLHFCNCNWFRFPYDPQAIEPYPAYEAMKTAMAPVLVSADLRRRHFYAGDELSFAAYIVNDSVDGADLPATSVQAELLPGNGTPLARTAAQVGPVPYYENRSVALSLRAPQVLPTGGRAEYRLALTLKAGQTTVAHNEYPLIGATREWAGLSATAAATQEPLTAGEGGTLIANGAAGVEALRARPELQAFVEGGGRILVMNAGEAVKDLLPDVVAEAVKWQPEIVNFEDEASPLLDGLQPWDVCWLNAESGVPIAATGGFRLTDAPGVSVLATAIRPHAYLQKPSDVQGYTAVVVFEAQVGKGKVIVSEINGAAAGSDPIAARLTANLVKYLGG
jgi:beta-galactosidase